MFFLSVLFSFMLGLLVSGAVWYLGIVSTGYVLETTKAVVVCISLLAGELAICTYLIVRKIGILISRLEEYKNQQTTSVE